MTRSAGPSRTAEHRGGSGDPLVLLHGMTGSWTVWLPVLPLLEPCHDVIVPTLGGHLGGPVMAEGVRASVGELTTAVERRLDELGLATAHFAGNSLGGWIALELARRGRARSVTALSPAGAWSRSVDFTGLSRMLQVGTRAVARAGAGTERFLSRPRARRLLLRAMCEHGERVPAAAIGGMFQDIVGTTVLEDLVGSMRDGGPIQPLTNTGCPIRIAWGEHDRILRFKRFGAPMLECVPDAEFVSMPGVGHVPMYDDPLLVARTILEVTRTVR